ncbi:MAG: hypothetical protein CMO09_04435 [Thalassospira sp.]|nr:hypothetical protein [Thalassospira sp.]MBA05593.1 hypothetical protein [Thalassospira sp.]
MPEYEQTPFPLVPNKKQWNEVPQLEMIKDHRKNVQSPSKSVSKLLVFRRSLEKDTYIATEILKDEVGVAL